MAGTSFILPISAEASPPASVRASTTCSRRGCKIPPIKLVEQGKVNQTLLAMYRANCRVPDMNIADINAMLAALTVGERRVAAIIARHGIDQFEAAATELTVWAAAKSREVQRRIPDGSFTFWDYMDDDFATKIPTRIRCTMTVKDGLAHLDYAGTDPQVASAYNVPTGGIRHPWLTLKIMHLVGTWDPSIPLNYGLFENLTVNVPSGTVLNPVFPAAVGVTACDSRARERHAGWRTDDRAAGLIPAPSGGTNVPVVLAEQDEMTGERKLTVIQSLVGGTGGRAASMASMGATAAWRTSTTRPSNAARRMSASSSRSMAFARTARAQASFAAAQASCCPFASCARVHRCWDAAWSASVFRPWGAAGGSPGETCRVVLNHGLPGEREIGKIDMMLTAPGDIITVMTAGGGGFGDPFRRDPERVLWT